MGSTGFRRHGLYYPFFSVRDDRWLKASALYWPRIAQLVPQEYPVSGTRAVHVLSREPEFLYRISPGDSVTSVGRQFLQVVRDHHDELASLFGVRRFFGDSMAGFVREN